MHSKSQQKPERVAWDFFVPKKGDEMGIILQEALAVVLTLVLFAIICLGITAVWQWWQYNFNWRE